jgi:multidrug resistance protein MdtO
MASLAQTFPNSSARFTWLWDFLKDELAPYRGRGAQVARMVAAATLVMTICMTFRIPYAFQGAIYTLIVSREKPRATLESAATILFVTGIGAAYILISMAFVVSLSILHFLWVIGSLFLAFYVLSTIKNYGAASTFAIMISVGVPLWDLHVSAETNVEQTLWLCLSVLIGVMVTGAVELVFVRQRPGDEVLLPMTERLSAVEDVLSCYAEGRTPDPATEKKISRLAMLGTSMLRRVLRRSDVPPQYSAAAGGVAVLIGRLVDLAASLTELSFEFSPDNRGRFRNLASTLASIRNDLTNREIPAPVQFNTETESAAAVPLLGEMERTVTLMTDVFVGTGSAHEDVLSPDLPRPPMLLCRDAFLNPEHLRFALKGCLAASSCYVLYNGLAWPGISTAVTTCLLTALSTIGTSRQKQMLRIAGAIVGGFVIGMGSQIFILPYIDSIGGFLVLFALVTAVSSWFMTSGPRLSYFGVQLALAFYLIHLQEFTIQTSLALARDRVVGVLLGLFMMWIVFDQLWGARAAVEMRKTFILNLRLLAQFATEPASNDMRIALGQSLALRETINENLDKVRALADAVIFEAGPSRQRDLELRSQIRQCQPQLRALFVMRIAFLKYRLQLPGFELPEAVRLQQQAYDENSARMLEQMADRIDNNTSYASNAIEGSQELLNRTIEAIQREEPAQLPAGRAQSFITLLRGIDGLTTSLASEIARENWQTAGAVLTAARRVQP